MEGVSLNRYGEESELIFTSMKRILFHFRLMEAQTDLRDIQSYVLTTLIRIPHWSVLTEDSTILKAETTT